MDLIDGGFMKKGSLIKERDITAWMKGEHTFPDVFLKTARQKEYWMIQTVMKALEKLAKSNANIAFHKLLDIEEKGTLEWKNAAIETMEKLTASHITCQD